MHGCERWGAANSGGELSNRHGPGIEISRSGEFAPGRNLGREIRQTKRPHAAHQDGSVTQRREAILVDGRPARANKNTRAGQHAVDDTMSVQRGEGPCKLTRQATDLGE